MMKINFSNLTFIFLVFGIASLPSSQASDQQIEPYQSQKLQFTIVSEGNCDLDLQGIKSNCQFPEIHIEEKSLMLPPLPYETKLKVFSSFACQNGERSNHLQARIGRYPVSEDNFLSQQDFTIDYSQSIVLNHPQQLPLGSIEIFAKFPEIFKTTQFPRGCEIQLEIEFNRIAFRSSLEASEHLASLELHLDRMKRFHQTLETLQSCELERKESTGVIQNLYRFLGRQGASAKKCQNQVKELKGLVEEISETNRNHREGEAVLDEFKESFETLSENIEEITKNANQASTTNRSLHRVFDVKQINITQDQIEALTHPDHMKSAAEELTKAQSRLQVARHTLNHLDAGVAENALLLEDFTDLLRLEISGPHGTLDQIKTGLSQIK